MNMAIESIVKMLIFNSYIHSYIQLVLFTILGNDTDKNF